MANLNEESLFSLELIVDELSILPNVGCRFPSIAFRLLDFPTLVIHHVDIDHARTIRAKVTAESRYKPPLQYLELQDGCGNYPIRKGKSCLFKLSANTLQTHLSNAPLYVMALDTYPDVPKLLGSCMIPLDSSMNELYDSICASGLSVPAVSGEHGTYELFSLMGRPLGKITAGVRLLSLGIALLPHIPDRAISRLGGRDLQPSHVITQEQTVHTSDQTDGRAGKGRGTANCQATGVEQGEIIDAVLSGLENGGAPSIQISPSFEDMNTQTERKKLGTVSTQTNVKEKTVNKSRAKNVQLNNFSHVEEDDGIFLANIECPPPLFYNSALDPDTPPNSMYGPHQARNGPYQDRQVEFDESSDDDETIRSEDRYSDEEFSLGTARHRSKETPDQEKQKNSKKLGCKQQNVTKNNFVGGRDTYADKRGKAHEDFVTAGKAVPTLNDLSQFPIIQALMAEIMHLQGGVQTASVLTKGAKGVSYRLPSDFQHRQFTTQARGVNVHHGEHGGAGHIRECKDIPLSPPIPKNKSWIRVAGPVNVHQSKITPGMTHTQRLRLARTNPKLLKELESSEEERVRQWKNQQRLLKMKQCGGSALERQVESNIQQIQNARISESEIDKAVSARYHKRPVPTPRSSMLPGKDIGAVRQYAALPAEKDEPASENLVSGYKLTNETDIRNEPVSLTNKNLVRDSKEQKAQAIKSDWDDIVARVSGRSSPVKTTNVEHSGDVTAARNRNSPLMDATYKLVRSVSPANSNKSLSGSSKTQLNKKNKSETHDSEITSKRVSPFGQTQILSAPSQPTPTTTNVQIPLIKSKEEQGGPMTSKPTIVGQGALTDRSQGNKGQDAAGNEYSDDFEDHLTTNRETNSVLLDDDDDFDIGQLKMIVERYSDDDDDDDDNDDNDSDEEERDSSRDEGRARGVGTEQRGIADASDEDADKDKTNESGDTSSFKLGEEVVRRKMINLSDGDDYDDDYRLDSPKQSANKRIAPLSTSVETDNNKSRETNPAAGRNVKLGFMPNPSQSVRSPVPAAAKGSPESARQPIAGSSTATPSPELLSSPRKSLTSNAALRKVTIDASPRKRTDESASYDESITENYETRPVGVRKSTLSLELEGITTSSMNEQDSYSEGFDETTDDDRVIELKNVRDIKLAPAAKFGYTWSGGT